MASWDVFKRISSALGRARRRSEDPTGRGQRLGSTTTPPNPHLLAPPGEPGELWIDSQAFPHILGAIISAAAPRELVTLRQTCRWARRQADGLLFAHVAVFNGEYRCGRDVTVRIGRPSFDDDDDRLAHTRVIDLWAGCIGLPFSRREVVRRANTALVHPPTATLVDYVDLTTPTERYSSFIHATGAYDAYVLHLYFEQSPNAQPRGLVVSGARRSHPVTSVTLVLHPHGKLAKRADGLHARADRFDVLLPFMHSLVPWLAGGATLTIVGVERCHPLYLGLVTTPGETWLRRRRPRLSANDFRAPEGGPAIIPALDAALRSRIYEISAAQPLGRSPDENWHWGHGEADRADEVAETMMVVGYDEWQTGQEDVVAEWVHPVLSRQCH